MTILRWKKTKYEWKLKTEHQRIKTYVINVTKFKNGTNMTTKTKLMSAFLAAALLGGCTSSTPKLSPSVAMKKYQPVNELDMLLSEAEKSGVPYLAPEGYADAKKIYDDALNKAISQDAEANKLAQAGLEKLRIAIINADSSKTVMREVLAARTKAQKAAASTVYPEEYAELETKLKEATAAIEHGNTEDAKELRAELIKEYGALELNSLQLDITRNATATIAKAEEQEAEEYAPKTFKLAQEELELALNVLSAGRTQTQKAEAHADKAIYYAKKSIYITETVKNFERRDFSSEESVLWYQKQLELINQPFKQKLAFDRTNHTVVVGIQTQIDELIKDKIAAEKSTTATGKDVLDLRKRMEMLKREHKQEVASLNQKVADMETTMKKKMLSAEEANLKAQARFDKIQAMFTEEEAYVYRQGDNVLLETHAFDFKVGGSEINSNNFDILEKIMDAIHVFGNPAIIVRGHTDATGGEARNMELSQKRAQTVASFLTKIGKMDQGKIDVKGYGESRPVASNETDEGRERNRRIEILIIN